MVSHAHNQFSHRAMLSFTVIVFKHLYLSSVELHTQAEVVDMHRGAEVRLWQLLALEVSLQQWLLWVVTALFHNVFQARMF